MFAIKRPINGISINGDEFILNADGSTKLFTSNGEARRFLLQNNVDVRSVNIVPISELDVLSGLVEPLLQATNELIRILKKE